MKKHEYIHITLPPDRQIFGQFLIEVKKTNQEIIKKAITIQDQERSSALKNSHRLLGRILLEDFGVFKNSVELQHYLNEFKRYKESVENFFFDAQAFGKKKA